MIRANGQQFHTCYNISYINHSIVQQRMRVNSSSRLSFFPSCEKQQTKNIEQANRQGFPKRKMRQNRPGHNKHVGSSQKGTAYSANSSVSQHSTPSQLNMFIKGRKAALHQRARRETAMNKVTPLAQTVLNNGTTVERKAKLKATESRASAFGRSMHSNIRFHEKKAICANSAVRKAEVETGSIEWGNLKGETEERSGTKLAAQDDAKYDTKDDEGEMSIMTTDKIEIQLPSPDDDSNDYGGQISGDTSMSRSRTDKDRIRRMYLVSRKSSFGTTVERPFTVLFPDELEKLATSKLPVRESVTPGWLSPVPYSTLDLSLAYATPEPSPIPSDHVSHLQPGFLPKIYSYEQCQNKIQSGSTDLKNHSVE